MTILTQEEITQFRSQLAEYPEALAALDAVQECDGYLEAQYRIKACKGEQERFHEIALLV